MGKTPCLIIIVEQLVSTKSCWKSRHVLYNIANTCLNVSFVIIYYARVTGRLNYNIIIYIYILRTAAPNKL